jgi:cell division protein FtsW
MQEIIVEGAGKRAHYDHIFVTCCLLLTGAGLVTLYSASYSFAERWFSGNRLYFLSRQVILAAFGFLCFFVISRIKLEIIRLMIPSLVIIAMILCVLPLMPVIGATINDAPRWIKIGRYTFQPSEIVKLVLPLYLAHIFDKKKDKLDNFREGIFPQVLITIIFFILIFVQNNFSTALFVAINSLVIFFLAGVRMRYFIFAVVMLVPISALLIMTKEHRLLRFISFFNPDYEILGAGYQVHSSVLTIASGGFWGKGLGQGVRKIASVPEIQSDFIFASFAEESGFIGVILFVLCFAVFAARGYRIALRSSSMFNKLLAFGLVTEIISQAIMNIAVVSGSIPATGVPLPFFSAGGSSLAITLAASGVIANLSRNEEVHTKEGIIYE